jgi:hypothetical protein
MKIQRLIDAEEMTAAKGDQLQILINNRITMIFKHIMINI